MKAVSIYPLVKRLIDVVVALAGLIFLLPLFAVVGCMVRVNLGSPILFRQLRPGLGGRPFQLIKFRTMRDVTDAEGNTLDDGARSSRFGRWLRASSLDELPELWNVLRGEMSLVGPRPLLIEYLPLYTTEQGARHAVRPGITGWAQVNGRNALSWEEKFDLDLWYVTNRSLSLDLRILWTTVRPVFGRHGISEPGHATMSKFKGSLDRSR